MNVQINPTLKPLIQELKDTQIKYYLVSTAFYRFCNENRLEEVWDQYYKIAKDSRNYFPMGTDYKPFDSEEALVILLNERFNLGDRKSFDWVLCLVLTSFINWSNKPINLDNIFKDLKQLNVDENYRVELKRAYDVHKFLYEKTESIKVPLKSAERETKLISFNEKKKLWIKYIAKSEIQKVVDELIDFGIEKGFDEFLILSNRWYSIQNDFHKGVIKREDFDLENNRIVQSLLNFVRNIENTEGYIKH